MRERPVVAGGHGDVEEGKRARIDLSVPQVAGSGVAAVLGAQLASSFGVYGTIIGAGVMSVVATCGGTVFQHFFKRTGEQLRVVTTASGRASAAPAGSRPARAPGEFTEGTVYRGRARGVRQAWKRTAVAAALVFGVAMAGITVYELAFGQSLSGAPNTTVGNAVTGENTSGSGGSPGSGGPDEQDPGTSGDSGAPDDSGTPEESGDPGGDGPAPAPSVTPGDEGAATGSGGAPDGGDAPAGTPDGTGNQDSGGTASPEPDASATSPAPSADSRSGTGVPDQGDPAVP
ncbi:hypothetical protein [Streptomyces prasinopilosus]|uniref:Uncharacterized protein n=1 Tax=Streptomyces prasinopilosus TaxID=67344 RepID=A0A1G6V530_9ACTN|nr:hypothetical protein [Streptomyces prasinopilosus]SDD48554.1 hypothetical protein SAMN05216505_108109 [Streptomyces prasinopilosus]